MAPQAYAEALRFLVLHATKMGELEGVWCLGQLRAENMALLTKKKANNSVSLGMPTQG